MLLALSIVCLGPVLRCSLGPPCYSLSLSLAPSQPRLCRATSSSSPRSRTNSCAYRYRASNLSGALDAFPLFLSLSANDVTVASDHSQADASAFSSTSDKPVCLSSGRTRSSHTFESYTRVKHRAGFPARFSLSTVRPERREPIDFSLNLMREFNRLIRGTRPFFILHARRNSRSARLPDLAGRTSEKRLNKERVSPRLTPRIKDSCSQTFVATALAL